MKESAREENEEGRHKNKETPIYRLLRIEIMEERMTVPLSIKHK